jgi:hypothetical protein
MSSKRRGITNSLMCQKKFLFFFFFKSLLLLFYIYSFEYFNNFGIILIKTCVVTELKNINNYYIPRSRYINNNYYLVSLNITEVSVCFMLRR